MVMVFGPSSSDEPPKPLPPVAELSPLRKLFQQVTQHVKNVSSCDSNAEGNTGEAAGKGTFSSDFVSLQECGW